ncbi:hypothetical protein D3C74_497480 [compost metagenome]
MDEAILLGQKIVILPAGTGKRTELEVLDNAAVFGMKHEEKRDSNEFFEQTKVIRKVMQETW